MKKKTVKLLSILLAFCLCGCFSFFPASAETVTKLQWNDPQLTGGTAVFSGTISPAAEEWVHISVTDPETGDPVYLNQKMSGQDGKFEFVMDITDLEPRDYPVKVGIENLVHNTIFSFHPETGTKILSFQLAGKNASISGNKITVTLPAKTNLEGLTAVFVLSAKATATVNGVEQISGVNRNNFKQPVIYRVTSESLATEDYTVEISLEASGSGGTGSGTGSRPSGGTGGFIYETEKQTEIKPIDVMDKFYDISSEHWAFFAMEYLVKADILSGSGDGQISPDRVITREEAVKLITKAFDIQGNSELSYVDIEETAWYIPYLQKAVGAGVIVGISETEFGVGRPLTRQDLAVLLNRILEQKENYQKSQKTPEFSDWDNVADYARDAVATMVENQLITGFSDGSFMPENHTTRAECAMMLYRIMQHLTDNGQ